MLNFKGIAKIFEEIELRMIRSLKRNLGRHKQEEQQENFQWTAWQAEKLRNLDKFRRENAAIMNEYADIIDGETRQLMDEQFKEGVNGVVAPESEQISETPQAVLTPEPKFFGVDDTKVTKLIDDVVNLEKQAETAALRTMDDVYRQTVNKAQLAMSTGSVTLQQAIDIAVKDFLDKGINCIVYRDGRRVNIADYVRMALRTTSTRAKLQGESAKYTALGYDTVQVSKYSMCSDTCLPWQGKAYINDVFVMWDGEVEERENGELWGKSNYCGKWFPLLSTAIHAGLFHPNCRHTILLYRDGDSLPKALDNSEIEKRYKLEQKQRRLENEVRRAKRRAEGFSDPDNIKKAKKEVREAQKKLREFIDQVNKEYGKIVLKRDYGREKIYDGENDVGNLQQAQDYKVTEKTESNAYSVNRQLVNSKEYHDKFENLTGRKQADESIYQQSKRLLENRDGTEYERMIVVDSRSGKLITDNLENGIDKRLGTGFSKEQYDKLQKYEGEFTIIHNHPSSTRPSGTDILTLWKEHKASSSIVVGHDGTVYRISDINRKIPLDKIYKEAYNEYIEMGLS